MHAGGTVVYSYDANGNLTSGDGRTLTYTVANKPKTVTKGATTDTFRYSPSQSRWKRTTTGATTVQTYYVNKAYEYVIEGTGASQTIRRKHYVGDYLVMTRKTGDETGDDYRFLLTDHLGSVDTITDVNGFVVERKGFDVFGAPRSGNWTSSWSGSFAATTRGFTGHEHLTGTELIHMNGRAYDPKLGKFLSVDPFIQFPEHSQSLNGYSYILNNPLSGTDPTGYLIDKAQFSQDGVNEDRLKRERDKVERKIRKGWRIVSVSENAQTLENNILASQSGDTRTGDSSNKMSTPSPQHSQGQPSPDDSVATEGFGDFDTVTESMTAAVDENDVYVMDVKLRIANDPYASGNPPTEEFSTAIPGALASGLAAVLSHAAYNVQTRGRQLFKDIRTAGKSLGKYAKGFGWAGMLFAGSGLWGNYQSGNWDALVFNSMAFVIGGLSLVPGPLGVMAAVGSIAIGLVVAGTEYYESQNQQTPQLQQR